LIDQGFEWRRAVGRGDAAKGVVVELQDLEATFGVIPPRQDLRQHLLIASSGGTVG
jgi:hypothetical protein